jgi:hypothetical protein
MGDLDLVVSVARAGGVDPEATASTTEMRGALIRESARLLKLVNITFAGDHVLLAHRPDPHTNPGPAPAALNGRVACPADGKHHYTTEVMQIAPPGRRCTVPLPRCREYSPSLPSMRERAVRFFRSHLELIKQEGC